MILNIDCNRQTIIDGRPPANRSLKTTSVPGKSQYNQKYN